MKPVYLLTLVATLAFSVMAKAQDDPNFYFSSRRTARAAQPIWSWAKSSA